MTDQITSHAEYRFLHDAEFHAKVALAIATIERERGVRLDESDRSLATLAAAVALLVPGPMVPLEPPPIGAACASQLVAEMDAEKIRRMVG